MSEPIPVVERVEKVSTGVAGRPGRRSERLRVLLGLAFSALCLVLAVRNVRLEELITVLGRARPLPLAGAVGVDLIVLWAIASRWHCLFPGADREAPSLGGLFQILNVAQLANAVLPARPGLLVRAYLAGQRTAGGIATAVTTLAGEKTLEGLSLLLIAVALAPFLPVVQGLTLWGSMALFMVALAAMVLLAWKQDLVGCLLDRGLQRWPKLLALARASLAALDVWRHGPTVASVWTWTFVMWATAALVNQLVLWSLDIRVPPDAALVLLVVLRVGVHIPSSPGSAGVFHYLSVLALALYGIDRGTALGFSILLHLVIFLPPSLLGLFFLHRTGYSLQRLSQAMGQG